MMTLGENDHGSALPPPEFTMELADTRQPRRRSDRLAIRRPLDRRLVGPLASSTCLAWALTAPACVLEAGGGLLVEHGDSVGEEDSGSSAESASAGDESTPGTDPSADSGGDEGADASDQNDDDGNAEAGDATKDSGDSGPSGDAGEGSSTTSADTGANSGDTGEDLGEETTGEDPIVGDVEISVTTVAYGGRYSPRHVGAVWIEDVEGQFLKTLEAWAARREKHLPQWLAASQGDRTDAVSGATFRNHETHQLAWDRIDNDGFEHGPGQYVLRVEYTEDHSNANNPGPQLSLPFHMGDGPMEFTESNSNFADVTVKTPG